MLIVLILATFPLTSLLPYFNIALFSYILLMSDFRSDAEIDQMLWDDE